MGLKALGLTDIPTATLFPLYDLLKLKTKDSRPCRAALTYQEGTVERGLEDVRTNVELWGTISEIKEYQDDQLDN